MSNYLTVSAICKRQGISQGYFAKLRNKYHIPEYKFGRKIRFDPKDIKDFFSGFKKTRTITR